MDDETKLPPSPSKSRFGRTRKPKISADFYNTDDLFSNRSNGKAKPPQISVLKSSHIAPLPVQVTSTPPQPAVKTVKRTILIPSQSEIKKPLKPVEKSQKPTKFTSPQTIPPLQTETKPKKPLKFFKSKTAEPETTEEHDIDVNKVMKLVTPRREFAATAVLKGRVKTYSNRKRPHQTHVVESFGLPDTPIMPTYDDDDDVWEEESGANLKNEEPFSPPVTPQYIKPPHRQPPSTPKLLAHSVMTTRADHLVVHESPDSPPVYIITGPKDDGSAPPKRSPQIKILEDIVFVKGRSTETLEEEVLDAPEVVVEEEIDCRDSCETFVLDDGNVVLDVDGTPMNFVHSNVEFLDEDLAGYEGQVVEIGDADEAISSSLEDDVEIGEGEEDLVVCMASSSNEITLGIVDDDEEEMLLQVEESVSDVVDELEANSTTPHSEEPTETESADENIPQEEAPQKEAEVLRESVPVSIKRSLIKSRPSSDKSKLSSKETDKKSPKKTSHKKPDDTLVSSTKPTVETSPRKSRRFKNALETDKTQVPSQSDGKIELQDEKETSKTESPKKIRTKKSRPQEQQPEEALFEVSPSKRLTRSTKNAAETVTSNVDEKLEVSKPNLQTSAEKTSNSEVTAKSEVAAKSEVSILSLQKSLQRTLNRESVTKSKVGKPKVEMSQEKTLSEETATKAKLGKTNLQTSPQKTLSEKTTTKSKVRKSKTQTSPQKIATQESIVKSEVTQPNLQTSSQKTADQDIATKLEVGKSNPQTSPQKTLSEKITVKSKVRKSNLQTSPQKTFTEEATAKSKVGKPNPEMLLEKTMSGETPAKSKGGKPNLQTSPRKTLSEETTAKSKVRKSNPQTSPQKVTTKEAAANLEASKPNLQVSPQKTTDQEIAEKLEVNKPNLQTSPQKSADQEIAAELEVSEPNLQTSLPNDKESCTKLEVSKSNLQTSPQKTSNQAAKSEVNLESTPNLSKPNLRKSPKKTPTFKTAVKSKLRKSNLRTSPLNKFKAEAFVKLKPIKHNLQKSLTPETTTSLEDSESNLKTSPIKSSSDVILTDNLQTSPQKTSTRGNITDLEVSESNLQSSPEKTPSSVKLKGVKHNLQKSSTLETTANLEDSESEVKLKENLQTSPQKTTTRGSTTNLEVSESNLQTSPEKRRSSVKLKGAKHNLQKASTQETVTNMEGGESDLQITPGKSSSGVKTKAGKDNLQTSPQKTSTRGSTKILESDLQTSSEKSSTRETTTYLEVSESNLQTSPEKTQSGVKLKAIEDNLQTSPQKISISTRGSTKNLELSESNLQTSPEKSSSGIKLKAVKHNLQKSSTRGSTRNLEDSESNLQTSPEKTASDVKMKASKDNLETPSQKTSTRGSTTNLEVSESNLPTSPEKTSIGVKMKSKDNLETPSQKTSTRGSTTNLEVSKSNLQTSSEKTSSGVKLRASKRIMQTSPQKSSTWGSTTNLEVSISNLETSPEKNVNEEKLKASKHNLETSTPKASTRGTTANLEASKSNLENTEDLESDAKLKVGKPNLRTSTQKTSTRGSIANLEVSKPNLQNTEDQECDVIQQTSPQKPSTRGTTTNLEARKSLNSETAAKSKVGKSNVSPKKAANQESGVKSKASPEKTLTAAKLEVSKPNLQTSAQKTLNLEGVIKLKTKKSKSPMRLEVSSPNLETPDDSEEPAKSQVGKSKRRLLSLKHSGTPELNKSKRQSSTPVKLGRPRKAKPSDDHDKISSESEVSSVKSNETRSKSSENGISLDSTSEHPSKGAKRKSGRLSTKTSSLGDISDDVKLIKQALEPAPPPTAEVGEDDEMDEANEWEDIEVVVKKEPVSPVTVQLESAESDACRFVDGDLAYARLGHFPYWPCMITKDPVTKLIRKKLGLQKWNIMWSYHVRFFGDRGRRSWVRENKIIPLKGKNDFANNIKELRRAKKYLQIPAFKVPTKLLPVWTGGLEEALSLRSKTTKQRYDFFFNMFASDEEKIMRDKEPEPSSFAQVVVKQEVVSDVEEEPPKKKKPDSPPVVESIEQSKPKSRLGFQIDVTSECSLSDTDSSSKWSVQTPLSVSNESQTALYKRNKLFKGVTRERVCVVCLKNGDVSKCKGKCYGFYHRTCSAPEAPSDNVQIVNVKDRHYEQPKLTLNNDRRFREMTLAEKIDFKLKEIMMPIVDKSIYADSTTDYTSSEESSSEKSSVLVEHVTADDVIFASKLAKKKKTKPSKVDDDFRCSGCSTGRDPECFACNRDVSLRGSVSRQKCSVASCGKYYHPACLKPWPQTQFTLGSSTKDTFTCPMHVCHICVSDNPRTAISRVASDKVVRCIKCPATYHSNTLCIPAGTSILSMTQIVCPRHPENDSKGKPKRTTINATWCFICARGGDLNCCETCPTSVHPECSPLNLLDDDTFVCEECETGRLPLYDEIVWVKLGQYRWWPALILFPNDVPDNVRALPHNPGEFVVKFFGTHDHYWVGRGRVFLFQEGDQGPGGGSKKKRVDRVFRQAVEEAAAVHNFKIEFKKNVEEATKSEEKPPYYIKIRLNKPVGNVKLFDGNVSNTTPCNCDPNMANPCGFDSYCLNRLLLTECDPEVCPAGERCQNQCFEKRQYPPLAPYKTEARGWGLKALAPIQKGQFIIEYVGEVIDLAEYQRRLAKMHEQMDDNYYFLTIDKDRMIDAGPKGNLARFMNHCCEPNSETQKWTVKGDTRVGLFATKDIPEDSEVTFNYNLECVGEEKKVCKCGAPSCSGFIGVKAKSSNEEKKVKRQRKKRSPTPLISSPNVEPCFRCGDKGDTFACHNKICNKFYHLRCVGMEAMPDGKWSCPWHNCNLCTKRTIRCCVKCTNSYCPLHSEGNVRYDKLLGFICTEHDPTKEPQDLSTSPVKKTKKSSISTEESDVTSTTQEEADGDVAAKPEEPADEPSNDARPTLPRLGGGVPYPKRKRSKQRRKLHLRKRIKFDEQYKHFGSALGKAPPTAPEVILTSSIPERHLRVGRKTSEDSESDRLLKRRRAFEKDLPMRKRTTPRTESADN